MEIYMALRLRLRYSKCLRGSHPERKATGDLSLSTQVRHSRRYSNNPSTNILGGPGNSGVDMVRGRGKIFQKVPGDDYDIIGFDPRYAVSVLPVETR